jgi:hypothetical protein
MAFANSSYTDIITTTIEKRSRKIRDNVAKNNALLARLNQKGNIKTFSGGSLIIEELSFAENGNGGYYSGYDLLPTAAQDVISAAQYSIKQLAVPVVISGLERIQNSGEEAFIDLMEARLGVAEATMANLLSQGIYSDGTIYNGKAVVGLDAAVEATVTASQTSTYGGISRTNFSFWRSSCTSATATINTAATVQTVMNAAWADVVRGKDRPDFLVMDTPFWKDFVASLQAIQRFTSAETGNLGFPSLKYMDADVVLDGGVGGFAGDANTSHGSLYLLNTTYLKLRPHAERNMVAKPNRFAVNQDAEVALLLWAGNMTSAGSKFQGRVLATTV